MRGANRWLVLTLGGGFAVAAVAHPGHGVGSLAGGVLHPLGPDHLLAMVSVGLWSVCVLPAGRRIAGPAVFMLAMLAGAVAGAAGHVLSWIEPALALSVALLGAMLLAPRALPPWAGTLAIAIAGSLHGLTHGAELPAGAAFGGYAAGFLLATAALHAAGLGLGAALARLPAWVWRATAAGIGLAGGAMLVRI